MAELPTERWIAPIRAIRAFSLDEGVLRPVTFLGGKEMSWGSSFKRIPPCRYLPGNTLGDETLFERDSHRSMESCTCGFHAFKPCPRGLQELLAYRSQHQQVIVYGEVELAGIVIEHEHGYRATEGRVLHLLAISDTSYLTHDRMRVARALDWFSDPLPYQDGSRVDHLPCLSSAEAATALMFHYRRRGDGQDWASYSAYRNRTDEARAARETQREARSTAAAAAGADTGVGDWWESYYYKTSHPPDYRQAYHQQFMVKEITDS